MIRPQPSTTRTDTLFPYTTLFRSDASVHIVTHEDRASGDRPDGSLSVLGAGPPYFRPAYRSLRQHGVRTMKQVAVVGAGLIGRGWAIVFARAGCDVALYDTAPGRSEERRVGTESVSTCRSGW